MGEKKQTEKIKKKSTFREYAEAAAIAILLALFIRTFIIQAFKIPSGSMKPTLLIGDQLLVNKFIYGIKIPLIDRFIVQLRGPSRGDIIVFKWPEDESLDFIKRVVGIEGDIIEMKGDLLYINGELVKTEYVGKYKDQNNSGLDEYVEYLGNVEHYLLNDPNKYKRPNFGPITVPDDAVFVLGDNRDNSQDSRYWGYVSLRKIKGKAMIIYWSWPNWKRFANIIR